MSDNDLPVFCHRQVQFDRGHAQVHGQIKTGKGIFRAETPGAAMTLYINCSHFTRYK